MPRHKLAEIMFESRMYQTFIFQNQKVLSFHWFPGRNNRLGFRIAGAELLHCTHYEGYAVPRHTRNDFAGNDIDAL